MDKENKEKITKDNLTTGTTIFFKENQLGERMPTALIPSVLNYVYEINYINVYRIDTDTFENIPLERIFIMQNPIKLNNPSNQKFYLGEIVKFKGCNKKFVVSQVSEKDDIVCIYEIEFGSKIFEDVSLWVKISLLEHVEPSRTIDWSNEEFSKSFKDNPKKSYKDYRFGIAVRVLDSCLNDKKYKIIIVHDMSYYNIKICLDEKYTDQLLMETMLSLFNPYKSFRIEDEDVVKDNYRYYMETRITEKMKDKNFNPSSIRCIIDDEFRMKGVKKDE